MSLLLHSQLEELLGASVGVEKLQLVSLLVEGSCLGLAAEPLCAQPGVTHGTYSLSDVNECSLGVTLCGEEAECFNGVGTYLCRCKKGYEDRSPMKSGTLCVRAPTSGRSHSSALLLCFLLHLFVLLGWGGRVYDRVCRDGVNVLQG